MARESVVLKETSLIRYLCFVILTIMLLLTLTPLFLMFYTSVLPAGSFNEKETEAMMAELTTGEAKGLRGDTGVVVNGGATAAARFVLTNPEADIAKQVYNYVIRYDNTSGGSTAFEVYLPVAQIHRFQTIEWEAARTLDDLKQGKIILSDEQGKEVSLPLGSYLRPEFRGDWHRVVVPINDFDFKAAGVNPRFINAAKIVWTTGAGEISLRNVKAVYVPYTLLNYRDILAMKGDSIRDFVQGGFGRYFLNSLFIAVAVTLLNILFASMAGYVFARRDFPLKNAIFMVIMATLMIPPQVTMVPMFVLMKNFGWLNTFYALIIPGAVIPFNIFLLRQYIKDLPVTLEEAARIDGANDLQIFWHVVLPLCKPVLAVVGINTFMGSWNNFLFPFLLTNSDNMYTLPVGLAIYKSLHANDWVHTMAGSAITALPVIIVFLIFQKMIIAGLTRGAVKE